MSLVSVYLLLVFTFFLEWLCESTGKLQPTNKPTNLSKWKRKMCAFSIILQKLQSKIDLQYSNDIVAVT